MGAMLGTLRRGFGRIEAEPADATNEKRFHRWPVENTAIFILALVAYLAAADYLVMHLHYMSGDAYSRVANGEYVIGSRDPHLGAIGFVWPPLPSFLDIPVLLLQGIFPFLATDGFAGSVEATLFSAGTVVLLNRGLRHAGVIPPLRWLVLTAWVLNPMTALYATEGMSEAPFVFFTVASLLVFLKWTETRATIDLAKLGLLVGLDTLVRNEAMVLAAAIGAGVVFCSLGRKVSWREIESKAFFYGLPALFLLGLWIGAMAILMHDPLYFAHSAYGNSSQSAVTNNFSAAEVGDFTNWSFTVRYVLTQSVWLFPAVVPLLGLLLFRTAVGRDRRPAIVLAGLALPIAALDIWMLHAQQLNVSLRYQIYVIPYAMVVGVYLLRQLRRHTAHLASVAAITLVVLLGLSDISSADIMSNAHQAREESVAVQAVADDIAAGKVQPSFDYQQEGAFISSRVTAANKDGGLIAMDTFRGFAVFMTAVDRSRYVVTSDEDFQATINQPDVYHVEYFLVPQPVGEGKLDAINTLYPTLWSSGGGFATMVADIGGADHWKLYKVLRPTGRG